MPVDPTGADLKRFLSSDDGDGDGDGPVVMLNLLRFAPGDDARSGYAEYARRIQPFLKEVGASVVYFGDCSTALVAPEAGWEWDAVLMVRYPSRRAFSEMVANPAYQEITSLRTESLSEAVLQATVPRVG